MNELLVIIWVDGLRRIRGAADIDGRLLNVERPTKPDDLGVGIDTILPSEAGVGVVLAGLNGDVRGSFQVLGDLVDDKIERLRILNGVVGNKTGVSSETRVRFLVGIILGRRGGFFGLEIGKQARQQAAINSKAWLAGQSAARKGAT